MSGATAVPNRTIKLKVNDEEHAKTTGQDGKFFLTLNLPPANNQRTTYQITASFEGDNASSATAYAFTPNGTQVPVCTTLQYGFKPSSNGISLTVEPQSTDAVQPTKTPEQIQSETEDNGWLKVWIGPGDSWWTWFKLYARLHIDWLNLTVQGWVGFPAGLALTECVGLENIFYEAYRALPDEVISVHQSAVVAGITTTAAAVAVGAITSTFAVGTPVYYIALGIYAASMYVSVLAVDAFLEKELGQSVLYGVGGTLVGFVIGSLFVDFLFNWNRIMAMSVLTGTPIQIAAVKASVNSFVGSLLKYTFGVIFIASFLNWEFRIINLGLGIAALYLAWRKSL